MNGTMWSRVQIDRPDLDLDEPDLLRELAPDRLLGALALLDPAARRRPERLPVGKLEAHEQDAVVRVEHDRAGGRADPELAHASRAHELAQARNQRNRSSHGTAAFAGDVDGSTKSAVSPRRRSCRPCSGRSRNGAAVRLLADERDHRRAAARARAPRAARRCPRSRPRGGRPSRASSGRRRS